MSMPPKLKEALIESVKQDVAMKVFKDPTLARDLPGLVAITVEKTVEMFDMMTAHIIEIVATGKVQPPDGVDVKKFREAYDAAKKKEGK